MGNKLMQVFEFSIIKCYCLSNVEACRKLTQGSCLCVTSLNLLPHIGKFSRCDFNCIPFRGSGEMTYLLR